MIIEPIVHAPWLRLLVVVAIYGVTLGFSSRVVRRFMDGSRATDTLDEEQRRGRHRIGNVIGKCENLIIVTFVLGHAENGLALIFAAKALARRADMEHDPGYFLVGTLVNFVWSLMLALIGRTLVGGL